MSRRLGGDGREGLLSALSRLSLRLHLGSVCRLGDGRVGVVHDAVEGVDRPQLKVGRLARQQLEDRAAERPDVGRRREGLHLDDLRRHPVGRADGSARLLRRGLGAGVDAAGDAKVGELDLPVLCDQEVGALDVSVADALCVKPLKPRQHLKKGQETGKAGVGARCALSMLASDDRKAALLEAAASGVSEASEA